MAFTPIWYHLLHSPHLLTRGIQRVFIHSRPRFPANYTDSALVRTFVYQSSEDLALEGVRVASFSVLLNRIELSASELSNGAKYTYTGDDGVNCTVNTQWCNRSGEDNLSNEARISHERYIL
jgi:hypothetical protein